MSHQLFHDVSQVHQNIRLLVLFRLLFRHQGTDKRVTELMRTQMDSNGRSTHLCEGLGFVLEIACEPSRQIHRLQATQQEVEVAHGRCNGGSRADKFRGILCGGPV